MLAVNYYRVLISYRFDQLKAYANQLQTASSTLLKARAKVAERVYGIYKIHNNYARVFKEWALAEEQPMKEALQKSSIEIEKWSNSIDALIDEEDIIAEQIKEYLYFSDSLKVGLNYCVNYISVQYFIQKKRLCNNSNWQFVFDAI